MERAGEPSWCRRVGARPYHRPQFVVLGLCFLAFGGAFVNRLAADVEGGESVDLAMVDGGSGSDDLQQQPVALSASTSTLDEPADTPGIEVVGRATTGDSVPAGAFKSPEDAGDGLTVDGSAGAAQPASRSTGPADGRSGSDSDRSATTSFTPDPSVTTSSTILSTSATVPVTTASTAASTTTSTLPSTAPSTTVLTTTTSAWPGPVAANDRISGEDDKDLKISVLKNDQEGAASLDKDTLVIVAAPGHADEFRVHGDHIHYRSVRGFSGIDQLRYRVCDDDGWCSEATVTYEIRS